MQSYQYVIIGGGMTGDAAVRGIRQEDDTGSIGMFSMDPDPPYNRPPLSKGLWKGMDQEKIWRQTDSLPVDMYLETEVTQVNGEEKTIRTSAGETFGYEKLLLATGGKPISLDGSPEDVIYFRTHADYKHLRELTESVDTFAVIGGGFIGSELAAALNMNDKKVHMIFPETGICGRIFPENLSRQMNQMYKEKGIHLYPEKTVKAITKQPGNYNLTFDDNSEISVQAVVGGLGIKPATGLAESIGLTVENGIHVNQYLQTTDENIYAAGDIANFYNPALDERIRVEHEDNANIQGMVAGINMTGTRRAYDYLPYFYSDLFQHGYEAVGKTSASFDVIEDWISEYQKGTLYYLDDGSLKGVLLWNVSGKLDQARELIGSKGPFTSDDLRGQISD